ncbi:MAG: hypothetical protein U0235_26045 [Polyangiaceae bacterium]
MVVVGLASSLLGMRALGEADGAGFVSLANARPPDRGRAPRAARGAAHGRPPPRGAPDHRRARGRSHRRRRAEAARASLFRERTAYLISWMKVAPANAIDLRVPALIVQGTTD